MSIAHNVSTSLVLLAALAGCAGPAPGPSGAAAIGPGASSAVPATVPQPVAIQAPVTKPTACNLVTAEEMSKVLARTVQSEPHEGAVDKTECIYKPVDAVSPYIELTVEWGEGETAMRAAGAMSRVEPGIADPYAGIGDQAVSVGPVLMIRTGEDLVSITLSGVDDAPASAKHIFEILKPRMSRASGQ